MAAMAAAVLVTAPAAPRAQPPAKSADQCFASRNVVGFNAPDDHTVYIRVGVNEIYRLDLMTPCIDLAFRQSIGLAGAVTPWVCSPLEATVVYRQTGITQRCPVKTIHRLTPDERAALPKRDRP
jgi:hypothetical protein